MRVGADTGGTFTDLVTEDGRVVKVLSTRDDPGRALRAALEALGTGPGHPASAGGSALALLAHGTTVATNALLERRGATVALVTTRGLADVIEIARQDRPSLYDINAERPVPLVSRGLRLEVGGRLDARGVEIEAFDPAGVPEVPAEVEAVAVCLLHADLDPAHERAVADVLVARGHDVSRSSVVSPEFREYERTVTTVVNAYLRPACRPYLEALEEMADQVLVMTSAGGLVPARQAAVLPAALLLSGPAGGVRAAAAVARACGFPDAIGFDMGGTSSDVCLIRSGVPEPAPGREVAGLPVRLPALDIHTIGAGGGSIARLDSGGALVVGPQSAGASPGPACYGLDGTAPTVTDANLVLGRIPAEATFPGLGRLDRDAAAEALAPLDPSGDAVAAARGVVAVIDAAMERALRFVSVERGVDPRGLALVAFGGAGPLHACALAAALDLAAVIVPPRAGALSAVGLLCSPRQREVVRSWPTPADHHGLAEALAMMEAEAVSAVGRAGGRGGATVEYALDCRYRGQSHEITVLCEADWSGADRGGVEAGVAAFHAEHERRNGYARPGAPVEVVALRARARLDAPITPEQLPPVERRPVTGPAVVAEADCTVWIPDGWRAESGPGGAWLIRGSARDGS